MFVELVDQLRCVRPHDESWLVASAERTEERDIVEGVLGCPICHAEYRITNSVAHFAVRNVTAGDASAVAPDEAEALRLAALLDLIDSRGYVILTGRLGAHARLMQRFSGAHLLLVNPPPGIAWGGGISGLTAEDAFSLAAGSARAAALDDGTTETELRSAVATVRQGGRLVAPVTLAPPPGVTELARDERRWVAERAASPVPPRLLTLRRDRP